VAYFEDILARSAQLGGEVDKPLAEARAYLSRADALNKQLEAARGAEEAEYAKLVESAATTGKLPTLNGWGRWIYDSPSSKLVVASVALCHSKAAGWARAAGPKLFDALQRRVAAVVDESGKLVASLPDEVVDEASAWRLSRGGGTHLETWTRLRELIDTWTGCHELLAVMWRAGWVPGPAHPRDRDPAWVYTRYERPLRLPGTYWTVTPPERRLIAAVAAGAGPGLYDWQSALERWERIDRRQRNYGSMEVVQLHNSLGNVLAESRSPETAAEFVHAKRAG
jgi:hypothetical protein